MSAYLYRSLKTLWNSPTFTTWASHSSKAIYAVLLLPIAMTQLTIEEINVWLLLNVFVGLLMLGDFGFSQTFSRAISHAFGGAQKILIHKKITNINNTSSSNPNWDLIKKIYSTTSLLYLFISVIFVLLMSIFGYYSLKTPISFLNNSIDGWISFSFILIALFIKFNGSKYQIFLQGINQVAVLQRNIAIISSLVIIVASITIILTKSLVLLILVQQMGQIIVVIVLKILVKKYQIKNNIPPFKVNNIDISLIRSILPIAWRSWIGVLMSYGLVQTSGIIIAQFGNASQTSSYLLSIKIMDIIQNFAIAPFYSKLPYFNQLFIKGQIDKIIKYASNRMNITLFISALTMGVVGISGNIILELIGSKAMLVNSNMWIILMIAYYIERYGTLHIHLYSLSNNIIWHIATSITGIIYISLSFYFVRIGLNLIFSFSFALLISYIVFYSWFPAYKSYRFFRMNFFKTEYKTTLASLIVLIIMIIINLLY